MKCSNQTYKLLHPYYYPSNHTQASLTSARPCIYNQFLQCKINVILRRKLSSQFSFAISSLCNVFSSLTCRNVTLLVEPFGNIHRERALTWRRASSSLPLRALAFKTRVSDSFSVLTFQILPREKARPCSSLQSLCSLEPLLPCCELHGAWIV